MSYDSIARDNMGWPTGLPGAEKTALEALVKKTLHQVGPVQMHVLHDIVRREIRDHSRGDFPVFHKWLLLDATYAAIERACAGSSAEHLWAPDGWSWHRGDSDAAKALHDRLKDNWSPKGWRSLGPSGRCAEVRLAFAEQLTSGSWCSYSANWLKNVLEESLKLAREYGKTQASTDEARD